MATSLDVVLLTPPLTDPTAPYHSLIYLASFARANGFPSVAIRDTNIEALTHAARPEILKRWRSEWEQRRLVFARQSRLSPIEQLEYGSLSAARALDPEGPQNAISVLRDPRRFYDYGAYRAAAKQLQLWIDCLCNEGFPIQFSPRLLVSDDGLFNLANISDLTNPQVLDRIARPFEPYFHDVLFPDLVRRRPAVIGITVAYTSQVAYALWLVRALRRLLPDTFVVCGGTEVSDIWKYLAERERFADLFRPADACVIGEGETAFVEILKAVAAGRSVAKIPNVVPLSPSARAADAPSIHYEDLDALPTPDYGLIDADAYFSPHPFLFYSPTRGCYWNKCTFCDYGLNFGTPTSPWRQRRQDLIVEDLRVASRHAGFIYLSVDVLAPAALLKLAQAIVDAKIAIKWAAEIRLEKYFNAERCGLLRRSGCVAISVGFESGNQRILDLIKKGTDLGHIAATIRNFTAAGIAVQMMGFTDFPSESHAEAMESIAYLQAHRKSWTVAGVGNFVLTPGAIVAQRPKDFGLSDPKAPQGADIRRFLVYEDVSPPAKTAAQKADIDEQKKQLARTEFDRPFAGGIDSAHSIFYYARYGLDFPEAILDDHRTTPFADDIPVSLGGVLVAHEPFDLDALANRRGMEEFHRELRRKGQMPESSGIAKALGEHAEDRLQVDLRNPVFIRSDGVSIPCSEEMWELLRRVDDRLTVEEIFSALSCGDDASERIYRQLVALLKAHRVLIASAIGRVSGLERSLVPADGDEESD